MSSFRLFFPDEIQRFVIGKLMFEAVHDFRVLRASDVKFIALGKFKQPLRLLERELAENSNLYYME